MSKSNILALIYLGTFIGPFSGNLVLPMISLFEWEFHIGVEIAVLTITAAVFPFAILQIFSGGISDIFGRRKTVIFGCFITGVGGIMAALSIDINLFLAFRVVQGVGAAFISPIMLAIIGDIYPYEQRGKVMGGYAAVTAAGVALGPIVGGFIAAYSWRYAFILMAILTLAIIPLSMAYLKGAPKKKRILKILPKIMVSVLKQFDISLACIAGLLVFLISSSTLAFLSDYLGRSPIMANAQEIGILLFIGGLASILIAPAVGFLIDAIGRKKTAVTGCALILLAFMIFTLTSRTYWQFLLPLIIMFMGQSMVFTGLGTMIIDSTTHNRGTASSIYNTFRFTGYGIGPALMSPIYIALGLAGIFNSYIIVAIITLILIMRIRAR